jgi:HEAT repeat protein
VLALSGDPHATEFLAAYLEDPDPYLREQALIAVAQNSHPNKPNAIRRALHDPNAGVRHTALSLWAGEMNGSSVYDALIQAANDIDASVRSLAVDRLGSLGDKRALTLLIERLSDDDLSVRQNARTSLRMLTGVDRGADPEKWKQGAR